ncbi:hypothetical protein [Streptosporangium longisporum]
MSTTAAILHVIPVGYFREPSTIQEVRTPAQRETLLAIVNREDFDFACNNPCDELMKELRPNYTGPFMFLYFTTDGVLHGARIGKRGDILRETTGDDARTLR